MMFLWNLASRDNYTSNLTSRWNTPIRRVVVNENYTPTSAPLSLSPPLGFSTPIISKYIFSIVFFDPIQTLTLSSLTPSCFDRSILHRSAPDSARCRWVQRNPVQFAFWISRSVDLPRNLLVCLISCLFRNGSKAQFDNWELWCISCCLFLDDPRAMWRRMLFLPYFF